MLWVFTSPEWTRAQQQSVEDSRYHFSLSFARCLTPTPHTALVTNAHVGIAKVGCNVFQSNAFEYSDYFLVVVTSNVMH